MTVVLMVAAIVLGILVLVESLGGAMQSTANVFLSVNSPVVQKIAAAIAMAEGFYISGSRPARNHNPGDMTLDLIGKSVGMDGPFVVYGNDSDGWANLYKQVSEWLDGSSAHASADSTISDISRFYTTTDQTAWATTVANQLGVSLDTPIGEVS
jgi:hypothetical protein